MNAERIISVLDWFLMEGGEPLYECPPAAGDDIVLDEGIFEIKFPDFEVYVGPPTRPLVGIMDVAVLLRPAMALEVEVIRAWLAPHIKALPLGFELEILPTEDGHHDNSLWLSKCLSTTDFVNNHYPEVLSKLMIEAKRLHTLSY